MPDYFVDTSAIAKHYHVEVGSPRVNALLDTDSQFYISRLSTVEFHSAFAKKVRSGQLSPQNFENLARRFRADVTAKRWRVVRALVDHVRSAERLIRRIGPHQNPRALDALQLAVALTLNAAGTPISFVCADHALCGIASTEGLTVINPEAA